MVNMRIICDPSDAKPLSAGSVSGTAMKALPIRQMTGQKQRMPARMMTSVDFQEEQSGQGRSGSPGRIFIRLAGYSSACERVVLTFGVATKLTMAEGFIRFDWAVAIVCIVNAVSDLDCTMYAFG